MVSKIMDKGEALSNRQRKERKRERQGKIKTTKC